MVEIKGSPETPEAAALQIEKSPDHGGKAWHDAAKTTPDDNQAGGSGVLVPDEFPADRPHEGGDPMLDGDAQYGASPIRAARYEEDHEANTDMAAGRLKSGHHGAQARYPHADERTSKGGTGHDEQQMSRSLKEDGR